MSEDEVTATVRCALSSLPPAPQHFTLLFPLRVRRVDRREPRARPRDPARGQSGPVPEVIVTGHTDTTGRREVNFELGLKRADDGARPARQAGFELASIEVTSHGEAALLVPTADDDYEPRNRRVEITIR